ncbi:MAG: sigma-70 family RNA polymerase sigma factor [Clostridia bacterium]|nr:sigma-70 family RNA polymerase sigma factor [Clostridia bacterium]
MEVFERMLAENMTALKRLIRFRIGNPADADDVLQETCLAAAIGFSHLKDAARFKPWLLGIARHKCADYYRKRAVQRELPLERLADIPEESLPEGQATETLDALPERDQLMLRLFYEDMLSQRQIAKQLNIPEGTVKSRLYTAREHFRSAYPLPSVMKGETTMKELPDFLPPYTIDFLPEAPFTVRWEEMMGWFIIPRVGERLTWGMYDLPSRKLDIAYQMEVIGRASVHGLEGVEIRANVLEPRPRLADGDLMEQPVDASGAGSEAWTFIAQMTDTHTRFLTSEHRENGVRVCLTFLDGDSFMDNWGFGEDNLGNPIRLVQRGTIRRMGSDVTGPVGGMPDIVGRCLLTLDNRRYDTVCVMDIGNYQEGVVSEQYLDRDGHTVLWRRFNADNWQQERYGESWSELLPGNERLTINGQTFVHWYDCLPLR